MQGPTCDHCQSIGNRRVVLGWMQWLPTSFWDLVNDIGKSKGTNGEVANQGRHASLGESWSWFKPSTNRWFCSLGAVCLVLRGMVQRGDQGINRSCSKKLLIPFSQRKNMGVKQGWRIDKLMALNLLHSLNSAGFSPSTIPWTSGAGPIIETPWIFLESDIRHWR